jgi:hypothetical protein
MVLLDEDEVEEADDDDFELVAELDDACVELVDVLVLLDVPEPPQAARESKVILAITTNPIFFIVSP